MNADIAQALIAARQGGPRLSPSFTGSLNLTSEDAYNVQRRVANVLGPVGGFKFAQRPGQAAIMAPIYSADIHPSGATVPSDGDPVGIELEVGFRILAPLPALTDPDFFDKLHTCVTPLAAIELVQTRLQDDSSASPELRLADNQINGGLVIGSEVTEWKGGPLSPVSAQLDFDNQQVLNGEVKLPFGDAFDCLTRLVRMIGEHCGGLQPGQVVITGSLNGLPYLAPGAKIRGSICDIGEVAVDLAN
jgi:2-keto-4-pentenoate hydratase